MSTLLLVHCHIVCDVNLKMVAMGYSVVAVTYLTFKRKASVLVFLLFILFVNKLKLKKYHTLIMKVYIFLEAIL